MSKKNKLVVYSVRDIWHSYVKVLLSRDSNLITVTAQRGADTIVRIEEDGSRTHFFSYKQFKEILSTYNKHCGEALMRGYQIDLLNGLGYLELIVKERRPDNLRLNMNESLKRKEELKAKGELTDTNWRIFYTDDDYLLMRWVRRYITSNITVYQFRTNRGVRGFRTIYSNFFRNNPEKKALLTYIPRENVV